LDPILLLNIVLLWVAVLVNLLLTVAVIRRLNTTGTSRAKTVSEPHVGAKVGEHAPTFSAHTLTGEPVTLATYAGRSVAFIMIGPSCVPCREALPRYESLRAKAAQSGVDFVLVSTGNREDTLALVDEFNLATPIILAPQPANPFMSDFKVRGTPAYVLIDSAGIVRSAGFPDFERGEWQSMVQSWESVTPRLPALVPG
jgi:peroxiredoxin